MTIRNVGNPYGPSRSAPVAPAKQAPGGTTPSASPAAAPAAPRGDSVQISDAARALAGSEGGARASSSLSADRVSELRQKVLEGAYDSVQVVDQVAKRVLSSGDL